MFVGHVALALIAKRRCQPPRSAGWLRPSWPSISLAVFLLLGVEQVTSARRDGIQSAGLRVVPMVPQPCDGRRLGPRAGSPGQVARAVRGRPGVARRPGRQPLGARLDHPRPRPAALARGFSPPRPGLWNSIGIYAIRRALAGCHRPLPSGPPGDDERRPVGLLVPGRGDHAPVGHGPVVSATAVGPGSRRHGARALAVRALGVLRRPALHASPAGVAPRARPPGIGCQPDSDRGRRR
jgi:hypothetical protein